MKHTNPLSTTLPLKSEVGGVEGNRLVFHNASDNRKCLSIASFESCSDPQTFPLPALGAYLTLSYNFGPMWCSKEHVEMHTQAFFSFPSRVQITAVRWLP